MNKELRIRHDQGLAIAQCIRGEISHGKLAEILGIDKHDFKLACGSFDDEPELERLRTQLASLSTARDEALKQLEIWERDFQLAVAVGNDEKQAKAEAEATILRLRALIEAWHLKAGANGAIYGQGVEECADELATVLDAETADKVYRENP